MLRSNDIIVNEFSISLGAKKLVNNASLKIIGGRRYGLIGSNGKGKTTLLKHIYERKLSIPDHLNILYVDQEIEGSDLSAYQTVLMSDVKLNELVLL